MRYSDRRQFSRSCFRSLICERVQIRADRSSQQNKMVFPSRAPDHRGHLSSGDGIAGWPPGRPHTASSSRGSAHCRGLQHAPRRSTGRPTSYGIFPWGALAPCWIASAWLIDRSPKIGNCVDQLAKESRVKKGKQQIGWHHVN
jgi:hypothetical protein